VSSWTRRKNAKKSQQRPSNVFRRRHSPFLWVFPILSPFKSLPGLHQRRGGLCAAWRCSPGSFMRIPRGREEPKQKSQTKPIDGVKEKVGATFSRSSPSRQPAHLSRLAFQSLSHRIGGTCGLSLPAQTRSAFVRRTTQQPLSSSSAASTPSTSTAAAAAVDVRFVFWGFVFGPLCDFCWFEQIELAGGDVHREIGEKGVLRRFTMRRRNEQKKLLVD